MLNSLSLVFEILTLQKKLLSFGSPIYNIFVSGRTSRPRSPVGREMRATLPYASEFGAHSALYQNQNLYQKSYI